MALIGPNVDELPDRLEAISPEEHTCTIRDVKDDTNTAGEPIVVVELECTDDTESNGRRSWDRFNFKYAPAGIKWKHFCKSAGHESGQAESNDLTGCTVRALFKPNTYTNKEGETVDATQVGKYLFDAE